MEITTDDRVSEHAARNLVLCLDGTNNQFGTNNTSVIRLAQTLQRGSDAQHLYYDPGVGTMPDPAALLGVTKRMSQWIALAFAIDLRRQVMQAYGYLVDNWRPGDRLFLFGFSRGAYAARVLTGILQTLGLAPRGSVNLFPYV